MPARHVAYYTGQYAGAFLPALVVYVALALWGVLAWQAWSQAPAGAEPGALAVAATATPAIIGRAELGQHAGPRSAAGRHLVVSRLGGEWALANRSLERRVQLRSNRLSSFFLQRWELRPGDRISFDGAEVSVMAADETALVLRDENSGREAAWRDGRLEPKDEAVNEVCRPVHARLLARAKWESRTWLTEDKPELPLFSIGGGVNCSDRWRIDALPPDAVSVLWQRGRFWLAPGARRYDVVMYQGGTKIPRTFADLPVALDGEAGRIESVILGRTRYRVSADERRLSLDPVANVDFWFDMQRVPSDYPRKSWIGEGNGPLGWLSAQGGRLLPGLAAALIAALAAGAVWWRRPNRFGSTLAFSLAALVPSILGLWLTALLRDGRGAPDAMLPVAMAWLAWFWATFLLIWSRRALGVAGWLWCAATSLAGIGIVTLLQLAAGSENSYWLGFMLNQAILVSGAGWLIALLCIVPVASWRRILLFLFNRESLVVVAGGLLIAVMALQLVLGSEEGLAGFQPVEAVKTVAVVLLGYVGLHLIETREREVRAYRRSPLRFLLPYVRFAGLFLLVVLSVTVGVRDFSPTVIIAIVLVAWLWKLGTPAEGLELRGSWRLIRPALLGLLAIVLAAGFWVHDNPDALPSSFPQRDRILVWAQPEQHPHSGSQVLAAMERASEGGWLGNRGWFGANGPVMDVPAVQNDFITAFFLYRFGGLAGLVLLAVQLVYLLALFAIGRAFERWAAAGDFREQNAGIVLGFVLFGLGWMQIAHWAISWGNTLGLLPVMGQPMSWLSAGNSHLLAFALPILLIALVTGWTLRLRPEEAIPPPQR